MLPSQVLEVNVVIPTFCGRGAWNFHCEQLHKLRICVIDIHEWCGQWQFYAGNWIEVALLSEVCVWWLMAVILAVELRWFYSVKFVPNGQGLPPDALIAPSPHSFKSSIAPILLVTVTRYIHRLANWLLRIPCIIA